MMRFLTGFLNLNSEGILRSVENLPKIIISGHNRNNVRYADDTVAGRLRKKIEITPLTTLSIKI